MEDKYVEELRAKIKKCDVEKEYVFVSYSKKDAKKVYPVIIELQNRGYNIWIDKMLGSTAGTTWNANVLEALMERNCMAVLFFMSCNSMWSTPVCAELLFTSAEEVMNNHQNEELKIIPINADDKWSPKEKKLSQWVNRGELDDKTVAKENKLTDSDLEILQNVYIEEKYISKGESSCYKDVTHIAKHIYKHVLNTRGRGRNCGADQITIVSIKDIETIIENIPEEVKNQSVNTDNMKSAPVSQPVAVVETPIAPVSPKSTPAAEKTAEVRTEPAVRNTVVNVNNAAVYKLGEKAGKYCAVIEVIGDSFRLLKGSKISANHADSTSSSNKSIRMEKSIPYGNYRLVTEDIDGSSSAIASVIKGASESGPRFMSTTLDIAPNDIGRYLEPCNGISETSYEGTELPQNNFSADHYDAVTGRGSTSTGDITYSLYGVTYTHNQSAMMLNVFEKVMERHSDLVASLINAGGMTCLSDVDYTLPENRFDMKPYFRTSRYYSIGGGVCVGTSYSFDSKLILIAKLLAYCGEPKEILVSDSVKLPNVSVRPLIKSSDQFFFV